MPRQRRRVERSGSPTAAAALVTIVGAAGFTIAELASAPSSLSAIFAACFLGGWVTAVAAAIADARRSDKTVPRALWAGLRTAVGWIVAFLP